MTGLLLIGHGTRSDVGIDQFLTLGRRIAERLAPLPVEPAFLELQQPDIDTAVGRLLDRDITHLVTMPLLLFAAAHAKDDIPQAVHAALACRGADHTEQVQAAHLGCHPALVELSSLRFNQALSRSDIDPSSFVLGPSSLNCLLLVGRGSHDESAIAEMHQFAKLRATNLPDTIVEVAFLAMARPSLEEQLEILARHSHKRIVVQPHLLFHGELVESLRSQVAMAAAAHPNVEWILPTVLADPPSQITAATGLIEKVILDRCLEVGIRVVEPGPDD